MNCPQILHGGGQRLRSDRHQPMRQELGPWPNAFQPVQACRNSDGVRGAAKERMPLADDSADALGIVVGEVCAALDAGQRESSRAALAGKSTLNRLE
jgi:hypothetical protein